MKLRLITILLLLISIKSKDLFAKQFGNPRNFLETAYETGYDSKADSIKGQILIHLSFPYFNNFHFKPINEGVKNNTGFMGYSVGLDFFHKKNQYVNFTFSQIQDYFLPIAFVPKGDEYELMTQYVFNLTNSHQVNRFSIGYGIVLSKNRWELINLSWDENSSSRKPIKKDNDAFGLSFSTYYKLSQSFHLGLIYRPAFLRVNNDPMFKYEHTISIDIAGKIRLKK